MTDAAARSDRSGRLPSLMMLGMILGLSLIGFGVVLGQWIESDARPACQIGVRP